MSFLPIDLSGHSDAEVKALTDELRTGFVRDAVKSRLDQNTIARTAVEHKSIEGLGRPVMEIDGSAYHYWGNRLGYQCWSDKQFRREFARDNPETRIKSGGTRFQVQGISLGGERSVRETKSYT